jgi:predicted transcriptional regulator
LEAAVMDHLWSSGRPSTVREVRDGLEGERRLAYTTVMTVMDNLHAKGLLARRRDGRAYRYRPTCTRAEHVAQLMTQTLAAGGDRSAALMWFVRRMDGSDVEALRQAVAELDQRAGRGR